MAENTKIEWCDHTFNPWIGCTKVSAGCAHCYAETQDKHRKWTPEGFGKGKPRTRTSAAYWRQPVIWNERQEKLIDVITPGMSRLQYPLPRPRVFCASLADWLDDEVPVEWLADLLAVIYDTPNLDWLLLTKRPENWRKRIELFLRHSLQSDAPNHELHLWVHSWWRGTVVPQNVWIGATVENQEMADKRIPELLKIPAQVRFLSCEPLLGAVDLSAMKLSPDNETFSYWPLTGAHMNDGYNEPRVFQGAQKIHWVICGFESGPKARPGHPDCARSLRDQCKAAKVPFFFKQHGEYRHADDMTSWEYAAACKSAKHVRGPGNGYFRVGKKVAGRLLDGVEHSEFPKI